MEIIQFEFLSFWRKKSFLIVGMLIKNLFLNRVIWVVNSWLHFINQPFHNINMKIIKKKLILYQQ